MKYLFFTFTLLSISSYAASTAEQQEYHITPIENITVKISFKNGVATQVVQLNKKSDLADNNTKETKVKAVQNSKKVVKAVKVEVTQKAKAPVKQIAKAKAPVKQTAKDKALKNWNITKASQVSEKSKNTNKPTSKVKPKVKKVAKQMATPAVKDKALKNWNITKASQVSEKSNLTDSSVNKLKSEAKAKQDDKKIQTPAKKFIQELVSKNYIRKNLIQIFEQLLKNGDGWHFQNMSDVDLEGITLSIAFSDRSRREIFQTIVANIGLNISFYPKLKLIIIQ